MKNRIIKTLSIITVIFLSNYSFAQTITSPERGDSLKKDYQRHSIVLEVLGKSWGGTISYEYKFRPNLSGGVGYGTSPTFYGGKHIGVVYGVLRVGENRKHFVTSAGIMFSNEIMSPNFGFGYEVEKEKSYFRIMPYAILAMDDDYPIIPSLGLYFGLK
ncbi:MAG: hypothetical protein COA49_08740 [Bacteroidetes bacterium]|nr:MAG: hypothetical protein COA49_08740 [Bacteroidota bacterium]